MDTEIRNHKEEESNLKPNQPIKHSKCKYIQVTKDSVMRNRTHLFIVYCLMSLSWGITEPIAASLFIQLQIQVSSSKEEMAFCFVTWNIGRAISAIFSGKLIDYFIESHRYTAISLIIFIASMFYLPFANDIFAMHIISFITGYTWSVFSVCIPVYVLRLYPECKKGARKIYIALCLFGIVKTVFPLFIQLSIQYTNKYIYPLYISNGIIIILIVLLIFCKTPQHDKLRTIKAELQDENYNNDNKTVDVLSERISKILDNDKLNKILMRLIMFLMSVIMLSFEGWQLTYISFAALYCGHYLNIDDAYGRYLISTYWSAQLLYRILWGIIAKYQQINSKISMLVSLIFLGIFSLIFIFIDNNIIWLFFLWGMSGFFGSSIYPEIRIWTELITPLTGVISTIYSIAGSIGGAIALYAGGLIIATHSVSAIKYIVLIFTFNGLLFLICNFIVYFLFSKHKKHVMQSMKEVSHSLIELKTDEVNTFEIQ